MQILCRTTMHHLPDSSLLGDDMVLQRQGNGEMPVEFWIPWGLVASIHTTVNAT